MKRAFLGALLASTAVPAYAADIAVHTIESGQVISIDGEVGPDDFDVFKAKASSISGRSVVFLASPGGNLLAAIQIGEFIRLRGWATWVFRECASGCALIWLAGTTRFMASNATIGFHAANYRGQEKGMGNALVGAYMNRLGLGYDAVIFATAASPDEMAYLTPEQAKKYGIDVSVVTPSTQPVAPTSTTPAFTTRTREPTEARPEPVTALQQAENETSYLIRFLYAPQQSNDAAASFNDWYWENAMYFGKMMSASEIIADKQKYFNRWPSRRYTIKSMVPAKCWGAKDEVVECQVSGVVDFEATSQTKRSVGSAAFEYVFRPWPRGSWTADAGPHIVPRIALRIAVEDGKVLTRQVTDLTPTQGHK